MDDLLFFSQPSAAPPPAFPGPVPLSSAAPHLDPLSRPARRSPSPAASTSTTSSAQDTHSILDVDSQAAGSDGETSGSEGDEEDQESEEHDGEDEVLQFESEDNNEDTDDLPDLSFSSPSPASSPSLEPTTPPDLDFDDDLPYGDKVVACLFSLFNPFLPSPSSSTSSPSATTGMGDMLAFPSRPRSPTQAEMDAFFGFVDPHAPPMPPSVSASPARQASSTASPHRARKASSGALDKEEHGSAPAAGAGGLTKDTVEEKPKKRLKENKAGRKYHQLEPIPSTAADGQGLTKEEKRTAIQTSLQRLALSVLSQLTDNIAPPARPTDSQRPADNRWQPIKVKLVKRSRDDSETDGSSRHHSIVFPRKYGKNENVRLGGRELAALLRVIEFILDGLDKRIVSTKRDLYYRDVALFVRQQTVDALVEDIAATLQVRRSDLNIVAAAKGLFAGVLRLTMTDGKEIDGRAGGALVPPGQTIEEVEVDEVEWVLIVEKEAVFQTLCTSELLGCEELGRGVLITGKGYPDLATRELVKRLSDELPSVPILALVDSDPHGLDILSTYRFGSAAQSFDAANLVVPRVEWLGVKGSEWDDLGVGRDELLPLTKADRSKALRMLRREWLPEEWRRELEYMLHLNRKAEIQVLSSPSSASTATQPSQSDSFSSTALDTAPQATSRLVEYVRERVKAAVERTREEQQEKAARMDVDVAGEES
ncbi:hypothetical protein JCM8097_005811 [Rhodosporidiobolus ruineniae]